MARIVLLYNLCVCVCVCVCYLKLLAAFFRRLGLCNCLTHRVPHLGPRYLEQECRLPAGSVVQLHESNNQQTF